jgi:hypothetical protein
VVTGAHFLLYSRDAEADRTVRLPSGGEVGLYQPTHASPLDQG